MGHIGTVLKINSNIRNYDIHFVDKIGFLRTFSNFPYRCYIVDENVWWIYKDICLRELEREDIVVLPVSEERKSLETVQELYDHMIERAAKRNMTMISIGGGTVQDITGFVASTLYRGINWVFVPTTLLAQADSCIGSKTSLNYRGYKNLIGTFYPPSNVYIYTPFLATQHDEHFFSGLGELAKLHILGGSEQIRRLIDQMPAILQRELSVLSLCVQNSLRIKLQYIVGDEFDVGKRNMLNFGHCFGHALESVSEFEIPHGQAVVLGMLLANIVARRRQLLSDEVERYIASQVLRRCLVARPKLHLLDPRSVVEAMKQDKKRIGTELACVMMTDGYQMIKVNDLAASEVIPALDELSCVLDNSEHTDGEIL